VEPSQSHHLKHAWNYDYIIISWFLV